MNTEILEAMRQDIARGDAARAYLAALGIPVKGSSKPLRAAPPPRGSVVPLWAGADYGNRNAAIRAWAFERNIKVSMRGRIPAGVLAQYEADRQPVDAGHPAG